MSVVKSRQSVPHLANLFLVAVSMDNEICKFVSRYRLTWHKIDLVNCSWLYSHVYSQSRWRVPDSTKMVIKAVCAFLPVYVDRYKISLLKPSVKALMVSTRTSIRMDSRGFLSMQYMIRLDDGQICFAEYFVSRRCNWMSPTSVRGGAIWWTLMKERQAWCICRWKNRMIHAWAPWDIHSI